MSPRERFSPDDPREWLNLARSNLALARSRAPGAYLEDMCFEAQQAAEKAIKSRLISLGVDFPYVHDLARLLSMLEDAGEVVPETIRRAAGSRLTLCSRATRVRPGRSPLKSIRRQ